MATTKLTFGTSTAITITLNSLAATNSRESTAVDNTTNRYLDALVTVIVKLASGSPTASKRFVVFAYGSEDGTNYTDNATGSDAAITPRDPSNLIPIGVLLTPASGALTYKSNPMSVAAAFGGVLPRKWGIVVSNECGVAVDSSGNSASYTGITLDTSS